MSGNGPFYPAGWYYANVDDHAWQTSKNGHPMLVIKLTPEASIDSYYNDASELVEHEAPVSKMYERTARIVINTESEDSMNYSLMKLRYAGFEGESFRDLDLRNRRIRVECRHEEGTGDYSGKTYERWELPLPPRESEPLEEEPSVARKLDTLFGRKLKAGSAKRSAPAEPGPEVSDQAAPLDDDDIPF